MATLVVSNPEIYKSNTPMEVDDDHFILNGQSWKAGQWLTADANSYLVACSSDADASSTPKGIKYQALEDVTDPGNNTTTANVGVITQDMVFQANELDGTVAATDVGMHAAIDVTSNVVTIDIGDTGNDAVEVVGRMCDNDPRYATTDVKAKILVKVLPACLEAEAA